MGRTEIWKSLNWPNSYSLLRFPYRGMLAAYMIAASIKPNETFSSSAALVAFQVFTC